MVVPQHKVGARDHVTGRAKQVETYTSSGFAKDGERWLAAMQDSIASQVLPAGPMGETHASNGRTGTQRMRYAGGHGQPPGLERSTDCTAQCTPRACRSMDGAVQWVYAVPGHDYVITPPSNPADPA